MGWILGRVGLITPGKRCREGHPEAKRLKKEAILMGRLRKRNLKTQQFKGKGRGNGGLRQKGAKVREGPKCSEAAKWETR